MTTINALQNYDIRPAKVTNTSHYADGTLAPYTFRFKLEVLSGGQPVIPALEQNVSMAAGEVKEDIQGGNPVSFILLVPSGYPTLQLVMKMVDWVSGMVLASGTRTVTVSQPTPNPPSIAISLPGNNPNLMEMTTVPITITATNTAPFALDFDIKVVADVGGQLAVNYQQRLPFAADETKIIEVSMTVPPRTWGTSGLITAEMLFGTALGNASATKPFTIVANLPGEGTMPTTPGVNVAGKAKVYTVNNTPMSSVGESNYIMTRGDDLGFLPYGVMPAPLVVNRLDGLSFIWENLDIYIPGGWMLASNEYMNISWWLSFLFVDDFMVQPDPSKEDPNPAPVWASAWSPPPVYMNIQSFGGQQVDLNSLLPQLGKAYKTDVTGLQTGGSWMPGRYDIHLGIWVSDIYGVGPGGESLYFWQKYFCVIKNAIWCTGTGRM